MNRFEEEIKNRLFGYSSSKGVDEEALWSSVSAGIQSSGKGRRTPFIWLLSGMLLPFVCLFGLIPNDSTSVHYTPRTVQNTLNLVENEEDNVLLASQFIPVNNLSKNEGLREHLPLNGKEEIQAQGNTTSDEHSDKPNAKTKSTKVTSENNSVEDSQKNDPFKSRVNASVSVNPFQETKRSTFLEDLARNPVVSSQIRNERGDLALLDTRFAFIEGPVSQLAVLPSSQNLLAVSDPLSFSLYGGSVYESSNFKGDATFSDSLNQSIFADDGYRFGLAMTIKNGKNWNLNAGAEISNWQDRFEKKFISDTTVIDNQSGDFVDARKIRSVRHFNKHSLISIPVEFELYKDISRLRLSLAAGASYSFFINQRGRGLNEELSLIDYDNQNKRYGNFFSFRAAPGIGLKLNDKLLASVVYGLSIQSRENLSFSNINSQSIAHMPALRLQFKY
ncbi:MAG: hypothetical protein AAF487_04230 [Bacteroidota bacterium]